MQVDWTRRTLKEQTRILVAEQSATHKSHLLAMPSDSGRDVEHLLQQGVGLPNSKWTIVDSDPKKIDAFRKLRLLEGHRVRYHASKLAKIKTPEPVDFAWFDLCGNLTKDDMIWLRDTFRFMMNADIWFTFSLGGTRGNSFIHRLGCLIPEQFPHLMKELEDQFRSEFEANQMSEYLQPVMLRWKLLQYLFPTVGQTKCHFYNDTQPMGLFHLKDFGHERPITEIDNFIGSFLDEVHLVHQIVGVRSPKKAREHQHLVSTFAAYFPDPEKFKARIQKAVERENKKLLNIVFE